MRKQHSQLQTISKLKVSRSSSSQSHLNIIPVIKKPDSTEDIINKALEALQTPYEQEQESDIFIPLQPSYTEKEQITCNSFPDPMKLNPNVRTSADIEFATEAVPKTNILIDPTQNKQTKPNSNLESLTKEISPEDYIKRAYTNLTGRHIGEDCQRLPGAISKMCERAGDVTQDIPDPVLSALGFAITLAQLHPTVRAVTWVTSCGRAIFATSLLQTILDVKEKEKPLSVGLIEHSLDAVSETNKYAAPLIDMGSFLFDLTKYHFEENRKESSLYK